MAGKGRAPKDPSQLRRRNIPEIETQIVSEDSVLRGPALPEGYLWHERTYLWWETWRKSAVASTFTDTDWDFLIDTATIHTAHWNGENVAAELRLRVAKFGATPEDRQRLRLEVDGKGVTTEPAKAVTKKRKDRLELRLVKDATSESKAV